MNKYIVENEPWAVAEKKDDSEPRAIGRDSLYVGRSAADGNGAGASGDSGVDGEDLGRNSGWATFASASSTDLQWGQLKPGTRLGKVEPVFPRADKSAIERMQHLEEQRSAGNCRQQSPSKKRRQEQERRQDNRRHKR